MFQCFILKRTLQGQFLVNSQNTPVKIPRVNVHGYAILHACVEQRRAN